MFAITMDYLLLSLLCLSLTFHRCLAFNTTEEAMTSTIETTEMYTSTESLTLGPDITATDPTNDECDFDLQITLNDAEEITLSICAYKQTGEDGDEILMVLITVELPLKRWVGIGFVSESDFDTENPMKGAYALIVPREARDFSERSLFGQNNIGDSLETMVSLNEDLKDEAQGKRVLSLKRKLTIEVEDLTDKSLLLKYFDFSKIGLCTNTFKVIYAYGANDGQQFNNGAYHGTNSGFTDVKITELGGKTCEDIIDAAHGRKSAVFAMLLGIVCAVLTLF